MPCDASWLNAFRNPAGAAQLVQDIRRRTADRAPVRIMEICGTHTMLHCQGGAAQSAGTGSGADFRAGDARSV